MRRGRFGPASFLHILVCDCLSVGGTAGEIFTRVAPNMSRPDVALKITEMRSMTSRKSWTHSRGEWIQQA